MSTVRREMDLIKDPSRWPLWPWLAVKRRLRQQSESQSPMDQIAVLHADHTGQNGPFLVYHTDIYAVSKTFFPSPTLQRTQYESVVTMLGDGWMVE